MLQGMRLCREIGRQPALKPFVVEEISPGPGVVEEPALRDYLRSTGVSNLHPVGTCRMGHDAMAVTDAEGLVHGLSGLRVVDGAILPLIPTANVNAPIIMVAEKIADRIRGRAPMPPEHLVPAR